MSITKAAVLSVFTMALSLSVQAATVEITDPPLPHNFAKQPVGSTYATQYFSVFNRSKTLSVRLGPARIDGAIATCAALGCPQIAPTEFVLPVGSNDCSNRVLAPEQGCSTLVAFTPKTGGAKLARLVFTSDASDALEVSTTLNGTGTLDADRVYDWAESVLSSFLRGKAASFYAANFYARCYANQTVCLGSSAGRSYLYNDGKISDLGPESAFVTQAAAAGF